MLYTTFSALYYIHAFKPPLHPPMVQNVEHAASGTARLMITTTDWACPNYVQNFAYYSSSSFNLFFP